MMEESDAVAAAKACGGDQDAFRVLVERHSHALFRLAYRMTGNEHDAEDVVQETFLRAYKYLDRFESRANFSTWLHRIASNCSLDLLRKRKRQDPDPNASEPGPAQSLESISSPAQGPDALALNAEVRQHVESALVQLTPMERTAFVLRHFEHRSMDEIGSALDLGQSAAKQAVFRAVQKLRRSLESLLNPAK